MSLLSRCRTKHQDDDDVCHACTAYGKMQKQISEAEAHLQPRSEEERISRSKLNQVHDPLHDIPPEIVSHIFECIRSPDDDSSFSPYLTIGAVCRQWREIAWSTPSLWDTLEFDINVQSQDTFASRIAIFEDCLSRSGTLPLTIIINAKGSEFEGLEDSSPSRDEYAKRLGKILGRTDVSTRIQSASLPLLPFFDLCKASAPSLNTLSLVPFRTKVENLTLGMIGTASVRLSCQSLTVLTLDKCTPSFCIQILSDAAALRSCTISIWPDPFPSAVGIAPVRREQLVQLDLSYDGDDGTCAILGFFTFPSLEVLDLAAREYHYENIRTNDLQSFFARSQCPLTALRIHVIHSSWSLVDLEATLALLPNLKTLHLGEILQPYMSLRGIFERVFSRGAISPRLITDFHCVHHWASADALDKWSFFLELFDRNQQAKSVVVEVVVPSDQVSWYVPTEIREFVKDLEALGWSFELKDYIYPDSE